jgi:hypothetical protein
MTSLFVFCAREKDIRISFVRNRTKNRSTKFFAEKVVFLTFSAKNFVGFSRGRDFECFMNHEVMKENTKVVTESVLAFPAKYFVQELNMGSRIFFDSPVGEEKDL